MEYLVRAARITDIDRIVALGEDGSLGRDRLIRSASNKGCATVEVARPSDPADRTTWARLGFSEGGPTIERAVGAVREVARRTG